MRFGQCVLLGLAAACFTPAVAADELVYVSCTGTEWDGCRPDLPNDSLTQDYMRFVWANVIETYQVEQGDTIMVTSTLADDSRYWGTWSWVGLATQFTRTSGGQLGSGSNGGWNGGGGGSGGYHVVYMLQCGTVSGNGWAHTDCTLVPTYTP